MKIDVDQPRTTPQCNNYTIEMDGNIYKSNNRIWNNNVLLYKLQ